MATGFSIGLHASGPSATQRPNHRLERTQFVVDSPTGRDPDVIESSRLQTLRSGHQRGRSAYTAVKRGFPQRPSMQINFDRRLPVDASEVLCLSTTIVEREMNCSVAQTGCVPLAPHSQLLLTHFHTACRRRGRRVELPYSVPD